MKANHQLISQLFSPLGSTSFFNSIYEKAWQYLDDDDNQLCSLFTSADLEEYLFASRVWDTDDPWGNAGVLCAKYPNGGTRVKVTTVEEMLSKFADGHTIVLQQSQKRWKKIADFCAQLSRVFNARIGANIYITPPKSQGFTAHYDLHDVLLLQTEGTKVWKVKEFGKVPLTLVDDQFEDEFPKLETKDSENSTVINLSAGQRLYMPRGTIHQGVAYDDLPSVHITFGIKPITWHDILSLHVFHPENLRSELLESVPFKYLQDLSSDLTKSKLKNIANKMAYQNIDDGLMRYLHQRSNALQPTSRFRSINDISKMKKNSIVSLSQTSGVEIISNTFVTFGEKKYQVPDNFIEPLKKAISKRVFTLNEIVENREQEALSFGKWLVNNGFATFENKE